MRADAVRGHLPMLLLAVLTRGRLHGYGLILDLKGRTRGRLNVPEGSVYPALHKLERDGLVTSERTVNRGRPQRLYSLTEQGAADLKQRRQEWSEIVNVVEAVLGDPDG